LGSEATPFIDSGPINLYINFLYWACGTSSSPSGDICAVSLLERLFQAFCIILFKVYFAILAAEFTSLLHSKKTFASNYLSEVLFTIFLLNFCVIFDEKWCDFFG